MHVIGEDTLSQFPLKYQKVVDPHTISPVYVVNEDSITERDIITEYRTMGRVDN